MHYTASGIITPIGGRPVHRLREDSLNLCLVLGGGGNLDFLNKRPQHQEEEVRNRSAANKDVRLHGV